MFGKLGSLLLHATKVLVEIDGAREHFLVLGLLGNEPRAYTRDGLRGVCRQRRFASRELVSTKYDPLCACSKVFDGVSYADTRRLQGHRHPVVLPSIPFLRFRGGWSVWRPLPFAPPFQTWWGLGHKAFAQVLHLLADDGPVSVFAYPWVIGA